MRRKLSIVLAIVSMLVLLGCLALWAAIPAPSNLEQAITNREKAALVAARGSDFSLNCTGVTELCANLITRAAANPRLKEALHKAKMINVSIQPSSSFYWSFSVGRIGPGYLVINPKCSDKRIIAFLTE